MLRFAFRALLLWLVPVSLAGAQEKKLARALDFEVSLEFATTAPRDRNPRHFVFSPEATFDEKEGRVRLARSVLLANEMGTTDQQQREPLSAQMLAKVQFALDVPPGADGELFIFGHPKEVAVNGEKLDAPARLVSTGWSRARVPARVLKSGVNEVVLGGGGSLLVEPGRPGKSFKSRDGGKTWTRDNLTSAGDVAGEYLVRLRLPQHAVKGSATTHAIDLWMDAPLPGPRIVEEIRLVGVDSKQPADTSLKTFFRLGRTPTPGEKGWTEWRAREEIQEVLKSAGKAESSDSPRWLQVKFELETSDPNESPRLPAKFTLAWKGRKPALKKNASIQVKVEPSREDLLPPSLPFVYQKPHARLEHLRKRYKLDEVIAPGKTEMEKLMLLRYWARNQWHTGWKGHPAHWMPPWDSLIILECKDQPECLTMCTHYSCVFTQCCQALGWNARHCILDHHCVSEVYSFEHDRWIMMDTGNSGQRADVGLHFERKGVPLSARELHRAYVGKKLDGITVHFTPWELSKKIQHLCREAPKGKSDPARPDVIPLAELTKFPVCQIENYRRYGFPGRNTFLTSLYPGELYQGFSPYFYDGYWWVGDSPDRPMVSPEYSRHLDPRRDDADWKLGGTRVHLSRNEKGEVRVDLESLMPNHAKFEIVNDRGSHTTPGRFTLARGKEAILRVRSVNHWGKAGRETTVTLRDE